MQAVTTTTPLSASKRAHSPTSGLSVGAKRQHPAHAARELFPRNLSTVTVSTENESTNSNSTKEKCQYVAGQLFTATHTTSNPTGVRVPRSSQENEPPSLSSHSGMSERIRKVFQDFNIRTVLRSGPTLGNLLTKAKDHLPIDKQSNVVYEVPCTCGKVYIGKTKRRLGTRIKVQKDTCVKSLTDKSAIAEHAWTNDHSINWAETKILQ